MQKNIFYYVLEKCLQNAESDTGTLLTRDMANTVNCSYESAKVILSRLIKKGLVCRLKGKGCKGGYIKLSIPNQIQVIALEIKNASSQIYSSGEIKPGNKLDNKPENNFLYSSSNINTTTVIEVEWKNLDIEPLGKIGFSETQLMQLQSKNTPEIVQESIYHFAYGLEHNSKFKNYSDPLNVLMGVLRKGGGWFEKDYKSPHEIAIQQLVERKKIQLEREKVVKDELLKLEFEEWMSTVSSEENNKISQQFSIPAGLKHSRETIIKAKFFEYFKQNICCEHEA